MKWIKWAVILLITLIVLAVGSIYFLFNPTLQKLKPEIVKALSKSLDTEVSIGEISAQILPSPKVELSSLSVGGENGAKVKRLFIDSTISQLLSGKLAISDVTIEEPSAEILKLDDGSFQIGKLKFGEKSQSGAGNGSQVNASSQAAAEQKSIDLKISKLSVTGGNFNYTESKKNFKIAVSDFSLLLKNFSPDAASPIEFAFSVFGKSSANVKGQGTFVANSFKSKAPLADVTIKLSGLDLDQAMQFASRLSPEMAALSGQGNLIGSLKINGEPHGLKTNLELDATSASLKFVNKEGAVVLNKNAGTPLKFVANGNLTPERLFNVQAFDLRLQDSVVSGASQIDLNDSQNKIKKLNVVLQKVTVGDLNKAVVVPSINEGTFNGTLQIDLSKKPIPELEGTLDISGANFEDFNIAQLAGKLIFKKNLISSESLDLKYKGEDVKLSGDLLRYVENKLDTPGLKISALGGNLLLQNNYLNEGEKPFSGSLSGAGVDLRRLAALLTTLPPYSVAGTLTNIGTTFNGTAANVKQDLSAAFTIAIGKGEIVGVNLIGGVFQKLGNIPGLGESLLLLVPEKYKPLVTAANSTSFDSFNLEGNLNRGTEINLAKAELIHSAYLILGSGRASTKGSLDLKTQMKITKEVTEGMVARNGKLKLLLDKDDNLTFPLLISKGDGPVIVLPDPTELGKNALRNTAKDAASKALDKVAPGLGTGASKLLNKLF